MTRLSNKYFIVRHGKLSLPYKDHSEMPISVLSELGNKKLNPPIDREYSTVLVREMVTDFPEILSSVTICASTIPRTGETAELFQDEIEKTTGVRPPIEIFSELDEVYFNLSKLHHGGKGIVALNRSVFRSMVSGKDAESYKDIFMRVQRFFNKIALAPGTKLVIAHDFIMRIVEIFVKNRGKIPQSITLNTLEETKRNTYVRGFMIDTDFTEFLPIF